MQFYLSPGSLKSICDSKSILRVASTSECQKVSQSPFVVRVEQIVTDSPETCTLLRVCDGQSIVSALLSQQLSTTVCQSNLDHDACSELENCRLLRRGQVLTVLSHSFQRKVYPTSVKYELEHDRLFLQIDKFFVLGFDSNIAASDALEDLDLDSPQIITPEFLSSSQCLAEIKSSQSSLCFKTPALPEASLSEKAVCEGESAGLFEDDRMSIVSGRADPSCRDSDSISVDSQLSLEQTCPLAKVNKLFSSGSFGLNDDFECSHRLNQLYSRLAKWSVRAYVTAISPLTSFPRASGGSGQVRRVQLRDKTGQLELVIFAPYCNREPFKSIKLLDQYHIDGGEIRDAAVKLRKWPY